MIFYHYTTRGALDQILAEGLTRGEAPYNERRAARAVNLTTDPNPDGHGLDAGGSIITEERSRLLATHGILVPAGTRLANKKETRITIKVPSSDKNLKKWSSWSRKHCDPGYAERLERSAGATPKKAKTWWLYFGVIPPEWFVGVDILVPAED